MTVFDIFVIVARILLQGDTHIKYDPTTTTDTQCEYITATATAIYYNLYIWMRAWAQHFFTSCVPKTIKKNEHTNLLNTPMLWTTNCIICHVHMHENTTVGDIANDLFVRRVREPCERAVVHPGDISISRPTPHFSALMLIGTGIGLSRSDMVCVNVLLHSWYGVAKRRSKGLQSQ